MQPYYLIKLPCKKIKKIAKKYLAGNWTKLFIAMFIYFIFTTGASSILDYFFSWDAVDVIKNMPLGYKIPFGGSIYQLFIWGPMSYGLSLYLITFFRSKKSDNGLLFEGFSHFGKSFALIFVVSLRTFLWTLLFIIPGIIASIRYSQAFFIMIDHPEYRVNQCINASKQIMSGNESKYFTLILSFIGWIILAYIPNAIYSQYGEGFISVIISIILLIPLCLVDAYVQVTRTGFYDLVIGKLVVVQESNIPYREKANPQSMGYEAYRNGYTNEQSSYKNENSEENQEKNPEENTIDNLEENTEEKPLYSFDENNEDIKDDDDEDRNQY